MKINITKTQRARLVKDWLNDMFSDADLINSYYVKMGKNSLTRIKKLKGFGLIIIQFGHFQKMRFHLNMKKWYTLQKTGWKKH